MKSPHANDNPKDDMVAQRRAFWEKRLGRKVHDEGVREISENVTGFFAVLAEWVRADRERVANDNGGPDADGAEGGAP